MDVLYSSTGFWEDFFYSQATWNKMFSDNSSQVPTSLHYSVSCILKEEVYLVQYEHTDFTAGKTVQVHADHYHLHDSFLHGVLHWSFLLRNFPKPVTPWAQWSATVSLSTLRIFVLLYHIEEEDQRKFPEQGCGSSTERVARQANKSGEYHTVQWHIWTIFLCVFVLFCLIFSLQRELSTRM